MLEFTQTQLINDRPPAGLTPRLASLVARCAQVAGLCADAVEDDPNYHGGGARFAIVTDPADLRSGGELSAFLHVNRDPLPEVISRLEGCHYDGDLRVHLLVLSVSEDGTDYLMLPDEFLAPDWMPAMDDLHPVLQPAVT